MTARERKFFDELLKAHRAGKRISVADAARAAGYSPNNPQNARQAGHQALEQLKQRMPDVFDRLGLTAKALVTDFLLPLMTAEQTKFFSFRKELKRGTVQVIEERQVADNGTRCFALNMAFKPVGHYAPEGDRL